MGGRSFQLIEVTWLEGRLVWSLGGGRWEKNGRATDQLQSREKKKGVQDQDLMWTTFWDDVGLDNCARLWDVFQELETGGSCYDE